MKRDPGKVGADQRTTNDTAKRNVNTPSHRATRMSATVSSIGRDVAIAIGLVVVIFVSAIGLINHLTGKITNDIRQSLTTALKISNAGVHRQYKVQMNSVKYWAHSDQIKTLTEVLTSLPISRETLVNSAAQKEIRAWMGSFVREASYRGFFIIGKGNINLASSRDSNIAVTNLLARESDFLAKIWAGETRVSLPIISDVPLTSKTGVLDQSAVSMFSASAVKNAAGEAIAILAFRLDPDEILTPIFEHGHFGDSGETYALSTEGLLLSESRFNAELFSMGLISSPDHSALRVEIRDPDVDLRLGQKAKLPRTEQPLTRMAQSVTARESGSDLEGYRDYRGVPVVGAWLWDEELGFGLATEMDAVDAFASLKEARLVIIIFSALSITTLLVLASASYRSRRRVSKHLKALDFQKYALDEHAIVSITDADGIITYVNDKFCKISGYEREELLGQTHRLIKSDAYPPRFYKKLWETIKPGNVWKGEFHNKAKDGADYWVQSTIVPFLDENGKPFQYIAIRTEVTGRKQAENARSVALKEAERANKAKSRFLSTMSHELRTPLNAIIGFSEMIHREILGPIDRPQYLEYAGDINDSGTHLLSLINEILDMSKIEAGEFTIFTENLALPEIVQSTLVMLEGLAEKAEVTLHAEIPDGIPLIIADKRTTRQILINLCANGIKFTPAGGSVTVRAVATDSAITVSVTDTGIGMNDKDIERAVEPFVQIEREKGGSHEGTGLGLSLCKRFAELQGGRFDLESTEGVGTVASFTIPASNLAAELLQHAPMEGHTWRPSMSVGVDRWDHDHQWFLALTEELKRLTEDNAPVDKMMPIFDGLNQYVAIHLHSEETVMKSMGYPHFEAHKEKHDEFRNWLKQQNESRERAPNDWDSAQAIDYFLNWWVSHILKVDMAYKSFFEARRALVSKHLAKYRGADGAIPDDPAL